MPQQKLLNISSMLMTCTRKCKQAMHAIRLSVCSSHFHQNDKIAPPKVPQTIWHTSVRIKPSENNQKVIQRSRNDPKQQPAHLNWQTVAGQPCQLESQVGTRCCHTIWHSIDMIHWFIISFTFATNAYNNVQVMFLIVNCGSAPGMLLLFLLARGCISKGNTGMVAASGSTSNAAGSSSSRSITSSSSSLMSGAPLFLTQSLSVFTTVLKMAVYCTFHLQHPPHQHQHHQQQIIYQR